MFFPTKDNKNLFFLHIFTYTVGVFYQMQSMNVQPYLDDNI